MADAKLTALTAGSALDGTELFYGSQGGNSRKITGAQIKTLTSASPTLVTPNLGTPSAGVLTNATGLPISTGLTGAGTGVLTALAVNVGSAGAVVVLNGALGTPSSGTATNLTGLPISTGVSGLAAGIATWLATPSSANLASAVTDETGSGALVFGTSPTISTKLTLTGATETTSNPVLNVTQTWNAGAVTFYGINLNITNTASSTNSRLISLNVGGTEQFGVTRTGVSSFNNNMAVSGQVAANSFVLDVANQDTKLVRDAANILALRNSTNAQTFRVYNTYTDASNYERLTLNWASNVCYLKAENAGTGSARLMVPVTGSTTVASLPSASTAGVGARSFVTDANATTFLSTVAGGGANKVPVVSDGTNWLIG